MKIIYTKLNTFDDFFELDLLHPNFCKEYKSKFEKIQTSGLKYYPTRYIDFELSIYIGGFSVIFEDFAAINSAIVEHNIPQSVVERLISLTFITKMRNMLKAYIGKFKESEVETLKTFYSREILSIEHKSWVYIFDSRL